MRWDGVGSFEWDKGNIDKNYRKHGITPHEAEEIFLDEHSLTWEDPVHSKKEKRAIIVGVTSVGKVLFVVFTVRGASIRIISARVANKKERRLYEEKNI